MNSVVYRSTSCKDSEGKILVKKRMRMCGWIGNNLRKACYKSKEVRQHCKLTCNACPGVCVDAPDEFIVAGQYLTCDAKRTKATYCRNRVFAYFCPSLCDTCATSSMPSVSQPPLATNSPMRMPGYSLEPTQVTLNPTPTSTLSSSSKTSQVGPKSWILVGKSYGSKEDNSGLAVAISNDGKAIFIGEPGAALVRSFMYKLQALQPKGIAIGSSFDPWFGSSIASSRDGSVVAVGCYKCNNYRGLVRLYVWDDIKWRKLGNDLIGDKDGDWFGWDIDISENGRSIIVGVYVEYSTHGYACVYDINSSGWKKRGEDFNSDMPVTFGFSVAISSDGNVAAIGAPKGDYTEVYEWRLDQWSMLGNRIHGSIGSHFGNSIALSSKNDLILAVGAELSYSGEGGVFVFEWNRVTLKWQLRGNDAGIRGKESDALLGRRISISEDGNVVAYTSRAKVGTSVWDGVSWANHGGIIVKDPASISLSGDGKTLAIGMPHDNTTDYRSGATAIFKRQ